jgi:ferritin-like metal-binding protein YciE
VGAWSLVQTAHGFGSEITLGEPSSARNHLFMTGRRNSLPIRPFGVLNTPTEEAMGFFTKDIKTLNDLFVHTLRDIYYAEQQIVKNLPDMIEKATDQSLKNGFETHLAETKDQIVRLEKVFQMHGVEAKGVNCPAIDGILKEASEIAGDVDDKTVLDAALIAAAQAVEHYEITRYGTLIAWANMLGRSDCASVLQQNLDEEKATDSKLNTMALRSVNRKAA